MKKTVLCAASFLLMVVAITPLQAQKITQTKTPVTVHGIINFKELADKELKHPPKPIKQRNNEEKEENQRGIPVNLPVPVGTKATEIPEGYITNVSFDQPDISSPKPLKTFQGLIDNNTVIPPDVMGAVGPTALFEPLNSQYRIFDKSGAIISTLSLSGFWSGLSTVGTAFSDPHVVYDATTGRWITCIIAQLNNGHYGIFVGVSLTSDPTGSWYEYSIDTGPASTLPDYPLLGYNKKWVVITTNDFKFYGLLFSRVRITILNKAQLLAGTLGTANIFYDASGIFTNSPAETMDANEESEYLLNDYNGNSGGNGYVQICSITGTPDNPLYNSGSLVGVNKPWSENSIDAPQKGDVRLINTNGTRMRSVIVRNGYIWATHTIYLPATAPTRSSIAWWQINPTQATALQYGRLDDPTSKYFVAYPSMAVTATNDVLIGSSAFGSTIYASAIYAYRNSSDAVNQLRSPRLFKPGEASYYKDYGSGRNRWGDYSATSLDPSNGTFWTLQEYAESPANTWGTYWANVNAALFAFSGPDVNRLKVDDKSITVNPNPGKGNYNISYIAAKAGNIFITVYNISGDPVLTHQLTVTAGINQFNINIEGMVNGNYRLVIQNGDESKQIQLILNK